VYLYNCVRRFRPPSVMGDQKYEHTQNITLQRILQAVINLQSTHQDMDAADAQQVGRDLSLGGGGGGGCQRGRGTGGGGCYSLMTCWAPNSTSSNPVCVAPCCTPPRSYAATSFQE